MKNPFIILLLILFPTFIKAQAFTLDTISIDRRMLTTDLDYQGKKLSLMKLEDLCKPFADANDEVMMAKRNNNPALLMTLAGAVLVGYSAFKWLSDGDFQWYFAAGGVVLIGATIPLHLGTKHHSANAAQIYNYEMKHKQLPKP